MKSKIDIFIDGRCPDGFLQQVADVFENNNIEINEFNIKKL